MIGARESIARETFRLDSFRCAMYGFFEMGWQALALLVVTRYFDGTAFQKGLITSAFMVGLLLNPISVFYFGRSLIKAATLCAIIYFVNAGLLVLAALSNHVSFFLFAGFFGSAVMAQQTPLFLQIYSNNYASSKRGKFVSISMTLGVLTSIPFAYYSGQLLDSDLGFYRALYVFMAVASVVAAWLTLKIPSVPLVRNASSNPFAHFSVAWENRVFGAMLIMWMLLGIGNLSVFHLRIEYMSAAEYGIMASNGDIVICIVAIPSVIRLALTPVWGYVFDRFNFFAVRAAANISFVVSIATFFFVETIVALYVASVFFGIALAGARVNWSLWVTKFAPPDQESNYMSVHGFLTGVRGVGAPFMGFYIIQMISIQKTAAMSIGLILFATLLLVPISRMAKGVVKEGN